ncbi:MAG: ABC transporter ATP-binding protein [Coriobacteriia bacterium]|nr:ABC transporter ATP-binding protein [Coriobacteriia bacterium]MBN2847714.1 ABC transporter ATP-binding protein [Coriobacteriia bacterium]
MLEVQGIVAGYGRIPVLHEVSLTAEAGQMVTLVGANGAGKSTLLKVIAGVLPPWSGRVLLEGEDVTAVPAHRRVGRGIVLVPEGRMLFGAMSVDENLSLGAYLRTGAEAKRRVQADRERVFELFPILAKRRSQPAGTLSGGEQQMLAVGRALMSDPTVLLLDEPSLGLAPKVISEIFAVLDRLREDGLTMVLVEQDARLALKHAEHGYVMRTGTVVLDGASSDLLANDDVRLIYLGAWHGGE